MNNYQINGNGCCDTSDCIYIISCKQNDCHMHYVGYTTTKLNKRLSGHRANIINGTEGKIMLEHFTKHHQICDMVIKPIDICDKELLKNREKYWMQELNTIFPYGLNNRIDINGIKDSYDHIKYNKELAIYTLFNEVKNNRTKRGSGLNQRNLQQIEELNTFDAKEFISSMTINVNNSVHKHCRKLIMGLKLDKVKTLFLYVNSKIIEEKEIFPYNEHLIYMIKDILLYRIKNKKSAIK